jgi:hypothetical protein
VIGPERFHESLMDSEPVKIAVGTRVAAVA